MLPRGEVADGAGDAKPFGRPFPQALGEVGLFAGAGVHRRAQPRQFLHHRVPLGIGMREDQGLRRGKEKGRFRRRMGRRDGEGNGPDSSGSARDEGRHSSERPSRGRMAAAAARRVSHLSPAGIALPLSGRLVAALLLLPR